MRAIEEYKVHKLNDDWIMGPIKWVVLIFGPNHQAKDLQSLLYNEYKNMNVIVVLISNKPQQAQAQADADIVSNLKSSQKNYVPIFDEPNSRQLGDDVD